LSDVERGAQDVGHAFRKIRDSRLYRAEQQSWGEYCNKRWDITASRANQLIACCEVRQELTNNLPSLTHSPTEPQVKALKKLPVEERPKVWATVVDKAKGPPRTAAVTEAVNEWLGAEQVEAPPEAPEAPPEEPQEPVKDSRGTEVDEAWRETFESDAVHNLVVDFDRLIALYEEVYADDKCGFWLPAHIPECLRRQRRAVHQSDMKRNGILCNACQGAGCNACSDFGVHLRCQAKGESATQKQRDGLEKWGLPVSDTMTADEAGRLYDSLGLPDRKKAKPK